MGIIWGDMEIWGYVRAVLGFYRVQGSLTWVLGGPRGPTGSI